VNRQKQKSQSTAVFYSPAKQVCFYNSCSKYPQSSDTSNQPKQFRWQNEDIWVWLRVQRRKQQFTCIYKPRTRFITCI